jgi:hypothetical protein
MVNIITRRNLLVLFVLLVTMSLGSARALKDEKCGCSKCHTTEISNGCTGCHDAPKERHGSEEPRTGIHEPDGHDEPKTPDPDEPSNDDEPGKERKGPDEPVGPEDPNPSDPDEPRNDEEPRKERKGPEEPEGPEEPKGRDDPEKTRQGK